MAFILKTPLAHHRSPNGHRAAVTLFAHRHLALRCSRDYRKDAELYPRLLSEAGRGEATATRPNATISTAVGATAITSSPSAQRPLPADLLLTDIRVVLVAPKHEANIGAVARACANFECLDLVVVAPRCPADSGEARKVACGDAVLDRMVVVGSLAEALADTAGSVGFTRRAGATRVTHASMGHLLAEFPWAVPLQPPPSQPPQPQNQPPLSPLSKQPQPPIQPPQSPIQPLQPPLSKAPQPQPPQPQSPQPPPQSPQWLHPVTSTDASQAAEQLGSVQGEQSRPSQGSGPAGAGVDEGLLGVRSGQTAPSSGLGNREEDGSDGSGEVEGGRGPFTTALVFGREESGLTEAELRLCSHACAIPTGRVQPSMNLSHAVSTVLAELFSRRCGLLDVATAADVDHATAALSAEEGPPQLLRLPHQRSKSSPYAQPGLTAGGEAAPCERDEGSTPTPESALVPASTVRTALPYNTTESAVAGPAGRAGAVASVSAAGGAGGGSVDAGLLPASAQEVDLLVRKVAAVAEAVGMSGEEGVGGGNKGNHGRRRLPVGHLRSVLSRARVNAAESRSLHGLASAVLQRLDPEHPLEARKRLRKHQQQEQQGQSQQAQQQQQGGREQQTEARG